MAVRGVRVVFPLFCRLLPPPLLSSTSPNLSLPLSPAPFLPSSSLFSARTYARRPPPPPPDDSKDDDHMYPADVQDDEDPFDFNFFNDNGDGMAMPVLDDTDGDSE